jgi:hypothetical protein
VPYSTKYHSTQMSVRIPGVIPAKAGIQVVFLDSGENHAGMTDLTMDTSLCGAVLAAYLMEVEHLIGLFAILGQLIGLGDTDFPARHVATHEYLSDHLFQHIRVSALLQECGDFPQVGVADKFGK